MTVPFPGEMMYDMPMFPSEAVLFPSSVLPLYVSDDDYCEMILDCLEKDSMFGISLMRSGDNEDEPAGPHETGCTARVVHQKAREDGGLYIVVVGEQRFRIDRIVDWDPFIVADVTLAPRIPFDDAEATGVCEEVSALFESYIHSVIELATEGEGEGELEIPSDPTRLADYVAARVGVDAKEKQQLLEIDRVDELLAVERSLLERERERIAGFLAVKRIQRKSPESLRKGFFSPN